MIFLIQYDRRAGKLTSMTAYKDADRQKAESRRLALELSSAGSTAGREIVLLEAASERAVRRTHRRYFESARELVKSAVDEANAASKRD